MKVNAVPQTQTDLNERRTESVWEPIKAREAASAGTALPVMQVTWSLVAGGSEMYAYTVAANLDSHRFQSLLCAIDKGGALEPEIQRRGLPFFVMNRRQGIDWKLMWRL